MASNVAVETDAANNLKPSKKKSTERIDGVVAGVMVLGRALSQPNMCNVHEAYGDSLVGLVRSGPATNGNDGMERELDSTMCAYIIVMSPPKTPSNTS